MGFTKNFDSDPLGERVALLLYGEGKIGKTRLILDLVKKHGDFVIMLSTDGGTMAVKQEPKVFKGKLAIAYPKNLRELRSDMKEARTIVASLYKQGIPRSRIWVALDTATHAQTKLIAEARRIHVNNPDARDTREEYVRDATTEVDWGINLGHMTEIADFLNIVRANVVVTALMKPERVNREETGRVIPALSGQSYTRFIGDADALLRLDADKEGKRFIEVFGGDILGGDRSGRLAPREVADLKHIQRTMIGLEVPAALPAETAVPKEKEASANTLASQN